MAVLYDFTLFFMIIFIAKHGFNVVQLHGHVICSFKLHYSFQLHLKVSSGNICWFYIKRHVNLSYLLNYTLLCDLLF